MNCWKTKGFRFIFPWYYNIGFKRIEEINVRVWECVSMKFQREDHDLNASVKDRAWIGKKYTGIPIWKHTGVLGEEKEICNETSIENEGCGRWAVNVMLCYDYKLW